MITMLINGIMLCIRGTMPDPIDINMRLVYTN